MSNKCFTLIKGVLMVTAFLHAILLTVNMDAGYYVGGSFLLYDYVNQSTARSSVKNTQFYFDFAPELSYKGAFVSPGTKINYKINGVTNYQPTFGDWSFKAGYKAGKFEIGFNHDCLHAIPMPVDEIQNIKLVKTNIFQLQDQWTAAYNTIYLKYSFSCHPF
jgi:hypothetical protein